MSQFGRPPVSSRNAAPCVGVAALLLLIVVFAPVAQTPDDAVRVHIVPVINRTGEAQFDTVASTVTDTVSLTLRLLGSYRISRSEPTDATAQAILSSAGDERLAALADLAAELPAENIVFGEVLIGAPNTDGSGRADGDDRGDLELPRLRLAVYDRLSDTITVTGERRPNSLFDIFSATDELAAEVLSGFSGRRVAFGSIRIVPRSAAPMDTGEDGDADSADGNPPAAADPVPYTVILDDEIVGENLRSLDLVLTGSHRLRVTAQVVGEEQILVDEEITVTEGSAVSVPVLVPAVDAADEQAAIARRRDEDRLAEVLAELAGIRADLESEREALRAAFPEELAAPQQTTAEGVAIAEEYFLVAAEFSDPEAVRDAAAAVAEEAAALRLARGRELFATKRFDAGAREHASAARLANRFDEPEVWGSGGEIGVVLDNWASDAVRRERKPRVVWGALLAAVSILPLGNANTVEAIELSGPVQLVPFVPALWATSVTLLWNSLDWDDRRAAGRLEQYGATGSLPDPGHLARRHWEVDLGIAYHVGEPGWTVPIPGYGFPTSPGEVTLLFNRFTPALTLRRHLPRGHALALEYTPTLGIDWLGSEVSFRYQESDLLDGAPSGPDDPPGEVVGPQGEIPLALGLHWSYSRSGLWYLRTGIGYSLAFFGASIEEGDGTPAENTAFAEELYGTTPNMSIWSGTVGLGRRFGPGDWKPWHALAQYRLNTFRLPGPVDPGTPLYQHQFEFQVKRSIALGDGGATGVPSAGDGGDSDRTAGELSTARARAAAETRWRPSRLAVFFDPGGFLMGGGRVGAEYFTGERGSLSLYLRLGTGFFQLDQILDPNVAWPGIAGRYYFAGTRAADGELQRGWYAGGMAEYGDFTNPWYDISGLSDGNEYLDTNEVSGGEMFLLHAEGGYRLRVGRSGYLDLGLQIGRGWGEIVQSFVQYAEDLETENERREEHVVVDPWWPTLVLSLGVPVF